MLRRRPAQEFRIHHDDPSTERTELDEEPGLSEAHAWNAPHSLEKNDSDCPEETVLEHDEEDDEKDENSMDADVIEDMMKLQRTFPAFQNRFRLVKRIGEGTFSTVFKAEDLHYNDFENDQEHSENDDDHSTEPPRKRTRSGSKNQVVPRRRHKYVAIKKIYVTSSPQRILNELKLLHNLGNCSTVAPLITTFRNNDQVAAVLPYFRHDDFREYFRDMSPLDTAIYLYNLFHALKSVHAHDILHRDIKPTNFLYDPIKRRGVLIDFGLAEREGSDCRPCLCREDSGIRKSRLRAAIHASNALSNGYLTNDTRPSRRANRAGTRGFRAPEVLFKCTEQTTKIDIWSVGVILLTILARRFPFFNSADDVEALTEIATIFGTKRMRAAGQLHGVMFETNIPTIGSNGFTLERIILWSTCRSDRSELMGKDEKLAVEFLGRCLELDPNRRISAADALEHDFLKLALRS